MIDKDRIRRGVIDMFRVNMGVKEGEKISVITDLPTFEEWQRKGSQELDRVLTRSLSAKAVSEIASEAFPRCAVEFFLHPSLARPGTEPGPEVAQKMREADVVIAITTYSLSHTDARLEACKAGARMASMPRFQWRCFAPGGHGRRL